MNTRLLVVVIMLQTPVAVQATLELARTFGRVLQGPYR